MKITIVIDNPKSWINEYIEDFTKELKEHEVLVCREHADIPEGDIAVFLSCEKIVKKEIRERNRNNLVVHASDLPKGKGWSPLTWQILEGKNKIPVTLFEAVDKVDAGDIYKKEIMEFEGHELIDEMRKKLAEKTFRMLLDFISKYPDNEGIKQEGSESFYEKRKPEESMINLRDSIENQFNLLRVVDNERYPAFFKYQGKKYIVKIYKDEKSSEDKN
jgi:methionyl-tRNA formyltransferase